MAFLNKLKELLQIENPADFACMCKKQRTNMTSYLNGRVKPGDQVLRDCLLNSTISRIFENPPDNNPGFAKKAKRLRNDVLGSVFEWGIQPLQEIVPIPKNQRKLPEFGGVYILYDSAVKVLYIGKAGSFRAEVWQTLNRNIPIGMRFGPGMQSNPVVFRKLASYMSLYRVDSADLRHNIEALLIRVFINQVHNRRIEKFRQSRQVRHR